jgi:hypothetical protein
VRLSIKCGNLDVSHPNGPSRPVTEIDLPLLLYLTTYEQMNYCNVCVYVCIFVCVYVCMHAYVTYGKVIIQPNGRTNLPNILT